MTRSQKKAVARLQAHKKERGRRQRKDAPSRSTQDALGYRALYPNGTMELGNGEYSRTMKFSDINYSTAAREAQADVFATYADMLNSFEDGSSLELSVLNRHLDADAFMAESGMKDQGDSEDELRDEMNGIMRDRLTSGHTSMIKEKYMTFTVHGDDRDTAEQDLDTLEHSVADSFHDMQSETHTLNGVERLEAANSTLRPGTQLHFDFEDLKYSGLTTHSVIAPTSLDFTPKKSFVMGDTYAQVLYLREYPSQLSDRLFQDLTRIPADIEISVHIKAIPQEHGLKLVKTKSGFMNQEKSNLQRTALKDGYSPDILPPDLEHSINEAEDLLDQMQDDNQKLFDVTFLVLAKADNQDDLNALVSKVVAAGNKNLCSFANLDYLQKEALSSVLMFGKNYVPLSRTLTTSAVAVMIPFTAQELTDKSGFTYGINQVTKNLVTVDRRLLKAGNGLVLGRPGGGKSFAAKLEMLSVALSDPDAEILVIDPEREYGAVAKALNGEVIQISPGAKAHINPLEINAEYGSDEDPVLFKTDFVISMVDVLLGGVNGLSSERRALVDRVCRIVYNKYFATLESERQMPTMVDFYQLLKQQPEDEAAQMAVELEPYIEGSLSSFAHETNVDTDNRIMVYDVKDLGKTLRSFGILVVLDQIWNHITKNRNAGKRTWIYIDEMQLLFGNELASNYFFELWSRARKWGALPTGLTQNVETMLLSPDAQRMLSNSEFILLLDQATNDRERLVDMLHLSHKQAGYITNSKPGHGLLIAGRNIVPFQNDFPQNTKLYKIMSTKPEDMDAYVKRSREQEES